MDNFETLLAGSAKAHGHLCPGQVVGVRMAMLGCRLIGLDNPKSDRQIKKLIIYVEIDRCATDAISHVTGVKLGRRSLKFVDTGIMAATFINLETDRAFRVESREDSRITAETYGVDIKDPHQRRIQAYKEMSLSRMFTAQEVKVIVPESDMPGPSRFKVPCDLCGVVIRDKKEVVVNNRSLCRHCAGQSYFTFISSVSLEND